MAVFEVIPCVDIQQGKAVRLVKGDPAQATVYFDTPLEAAQHWVRLGAQQLHLVDLDAALGRGDNRALIAEIAGRVKARLEVGGGIRSLEAARSWLALVDRIVLGTLAIAEPQVLTQLLNEFGPERIVVSLDAKDGLVALRGWAEVSQLSALALAERVAAQGVRQVIYTDISRDGTLAGVDLEPLRALRDRFPYRLIAGGGVASDDDLARYASLGLDGAIVGRALYEGRVSYPPVV